MKLTKGIDLARKEEQQISDEKAEEAVKTIIEWIGEDPKREGLASTPKRGVKAFKEYFKGYKQNPDQYLSKPPYHLSLKRYFHRTIKLQAVSLLIVLMIYSLKIKKKVSHARIELATSASLGRN